MIIPVSIENENEWAKLCVALWFTLLACHANARSSFYASHFLT